MQKYITQIIEDNNLKYIETLRSSSKYKTDSELLLVKKVNNKYAIKIFSSKDTFARDRFIYEVNTILQTRRKISKKFKHAIPKIIKYDTKGDHPYYVYEYIAGDSVGLFIEDFGVKWGVFHPTNFHSFLNLIHELSLLNMDVKDEYRWGARYSRKEMQYYLENDGHLIPSNLYYEIQSFYEKYSKRSFNKMVLSHRDLYPENILQDPKDKKKFAILDWEHFGFVPYGYDAALLFLLLWKEEFWKAKVFSYYYNYYENSNDKNDLKLFLISFRLSLVLLALRFMHQVESFGNKESIHYENAKRSYLFDMESALDGNIIKPKNVKFYINENDIKKVASRYGIKGVEGYQIFYASKGNTVARVTTKNGDYVFRFYADSRSRTLIKRELRIFETLKGAGIKTYSVIRSLDNELFISQPLYGKERRIAVFGYLKGKKISKRWYGETSIENAGKTLREIHNCDIVHGDYSKENVLYNRTIVSGVIDFEWGRFTKSKKAKDSDLAKSIALWLIDIRINTVDETIMVKSFLRGYLGKDPDERTLIYFCKLIMEKVNIEREIFLTTIDRRYAKNGSRRFDSAIRKVKRILPSDID